MPRLIAALIRHGDYAQLADAPSAHQPFALTVTGRQQAAAAAASVVAEAHAQRWSVCPVVDCSHLLRAWQTARLLADAIAADLADGIELVESDALAERAVGIAGNLTLQQIEDVIASDPRYPDPPRDWKANADYCLPFPGAESLMQAGQRVADHVRARMQALAAAVECDTVKLFVGHGAAFRHAAYHLGVLDRGEISALSMYHAVPVYLETGAAGDWRHIAGRWKARGTAARAPD